MDDPRSKDREVLRLLLRTRVDFQKTREAIDNRVARKADGGDQDIVQRFESGLGDELRIVADDAKRMENNVEKLLLGHLKTFPVYNQYLKDVKGVGTISAAWIIGEIDVYKATTVSKIWQYAGLNPGMVRGKKSVAKSDYKKGMGQIAGELPPLKDGKVRVCVLTDELIRGDRKTAGFLCPYNARLKAALCGVLAKNGFIMGKRAYSKYYYDYKARLESSDKITTERKGNGKVDEVAWKDARKGHRDAASIRYMIKMFLLDVYLAWREIEGLPIRKPYAEEYLDKKHSGD